MWPVPLLNRLHAESAAVLALAAFCIGGLAALHRLSRGERAGSIIRGRIAFLGLPMLLMLTPMLWAPNCGWKAGVGFFLLFPAISVVLAVSVAMLVASRVRGRRTLVFLLVGAALVVLGPLFDLGLHPQFYTYNHVFGGILSPIYDEQLAVRPGLFVFRAMTLLWAGVAASAALGRFLMSLGLAGLLALAYIFGGTLGINTTYHGLSVALPGVLSTTHFEIRYDPEKTDSVRLGQYRDTFEFEYHRIAASMDVEVSGRILGVVYPDAATRARLTGARYTSVSPVWLVRPQLHILDSGLETVFAHELAHVFSREFGLPIVRASTSVGLVEGLASALEPPSGRPSAHDLVSAAATATGLDPGEQLPAVLAPWGFWTGRGGVSYTVAGSFVRYLLTAYGPAPLKEAYAWSTFEDAYGRPVSELVSEWRDYLHARAFVDVDAVTRARIRLGATSLFERNCPHFLRPEILQLQRMEIAWGRADTVAALAHIEIARIRAPGSSRILDAWVRAQLRVGEGQTVRDTISARPDSVLSRGLLVLKADFMVSDGDSSRARGIYRRVLSGLPTYAREPRLGLALRMASAGDQASGKSITHRGPPEAIATPAGRALRALLDPSLELPDPGPLPAWAARAWPAHQALRMAELSYGEGLVNQAALLAERSADLFLAVGDPAMSAHVRHAARRYSFAAARSPAEIP